MKFLVLAIALLSVQTSLAYDMNVYPNADAPLSSSISKPIGRGRVMNFPEALQAWKNGKKTDEKTLTGKWLLVSYSSSSDCFLGTDNQYDPRGVSFNFGEPPLQLKFGYTNSDFDARKKFAVRISNLGDASQGPYIVNPQEPQFATHMYKENSNEPSEHHIKYSCRLANGDSSRLLCAGGVALAYFPVDDYNLERCSQRKYFEVQGFVKLRSDDF